MGSKYSKEHWIPDKEATACGKCGAAFTAFNRRHHCRNCGRLFCGKCAWRFIAIPNRDIPTSERVCDECYMELLDDSQANSRPATQSPAGGGAIMSQRGLHSNLGGQGGKPGSPTMSTHSPLPLGPQTAPPAAHVDVFAATMDRIRRETKLFSLRDVPIGVDPNEDFELRWVDGAPPDGRSHVNCLASDTIFAADSAQALELDHLFAPVVVKSNTTGTTHLERMQSVLNVLIA